MGDLQHQLQQQQQLMMMIVQQVYQQVSMQQMEVHALHRQIKSMLYHQHQQSADDSGLGQDLCVPLPLMFSPMLARPDPLAFNPMYMSPSSRLLRRATTDEEDAEEGAYRAEPAEQASDNRPRAARGSSRGSRGDLYSQKLKKCSPSPAQLNNAAAVSKSKSASVQTYLEEDPGEISASEGPILPLKFEQGIARQKR